MTTEGEPAKKGDFVDDLVAWGCKVFHLTGHQKILTQLAKFVIAGVTTTLVDWLVYFVLVESVKMDPLIAQLFSFLISTGVSYPMNAVWVFDTTKGKTRARLITEFFVFSAVALGISEALLWVFIYKLGMNELIAKVLTTAVTMVFNFVTRKIFLEDRKKG